MKIISNFDDLDNMKGNLQLEIRLQTAGTSPLRDPK